VLEFKPNVKNWEFEPCFLLSHADVAYETPSWLWNTFLDNHVKKRNSNWSKG